MSSYFRICPLRNSSRFVRFVFTSRKKPTTCPCASLYCGGSPYLLQQPTPYTTNVILDLNPEPTVSKNHSSPQLPTMLLGRKNFNGQETYRYVDHCFQLVPWCSLLFVQEGGQKVKVSIPHLRCSVYSIWQEKDGFSREMC